METDWSNPTSADTGKLPPLEGLFHALAHEGRSVLMVSDDEALLDTCGQSVVRKLRQHQAVEVSAMFDMDREVLLQRFNRLIETLSVDQALQSVGAPPTQQVWLQHIHNSQELEQAKLLIRLSGDFPAAGVKLLLMANNLCADDLIHHGQTKNLLVWHAPVTRKAVVPAGPTGAKPLAAAATAAPHWLDDAAADLPVDFSFTKPPATTSRVGKGQRWVVQLLLGVFVMVSVAVLGLHQWQNSQVPDAPVAEAPASNTDQGAITSSPAAPVAGPTTEPAPPPTAEPTVVVPPIAGPAPAVVLPPEPSPTPPVAEARVASAEWARQLKTGGWVVQHVALDSSREIQTWQDQYPALKQAQAVPLLRPNGQRYWVLVSGPFTSLERANAFAQTPGVPKNHWSRGVASLQSSLDDKP
jgi:septal ring-binding cell division protein DamX